MKGGIPRRSPTPYMLFGLRWIVEVISRRVKIVQTATEAVRPVHGILRRFPDSVLEILLVADNAKVDPVHAMRDAVEIVRSGREC